MKIDPHYSTAALAAALLIAVASAGCTSSYSVEVPAPAPSAGAPVSDIPAQTHAVNWDKVPVAAVTEGF